MGLGLAATYSILKSHNAKMQIKSYPDKGTEFIIDFNKYPLQQIESAPSAEVAENGHAKAVKPVRVAN